MVGTVNAKYPRILLGCAALISAAAFVAARFGYGSDDGFVGSNSTAAPAAAAGGGAPVAAPLASRGAGVRGGIAPVFSRGGAAGAPAIEALPQSVTDRGAGGQDSGRTPAPVWHDRVAPPVVPAQGEADMFAYHKELWPPDSMDLFSLLFSIMALLIAAGGGIGGGGILVPLFMIFLKFRPKHAIALSNFTILGGAIANTAFNVQKSDAAGGSLIDWDIIVMMEPSTIAGAVVGSYASKYLPDFVLTVALATVLAMLTFRTLDKGIKMFQKESEEEAKRQEVGSPALNQDEMDPCSDEDGANESQGLMRGGGGGQGASNAAAETSTPWSKIVLLVLCFVGCVALTILKGSGHGSVIGVECGSITFWLLSMSPVPWVLFFGWIFRHMLIAENEQKLRSGHKFDCNDIRWDAKSTIRYPLICTVAGIFAGLFGVGGGIIKGPLMLEMGVNPVVAAATAATMILFTTSAACVSFHIFGLLEPYYGITGFFLGLVCTAVGQGAINSWMRTARRQSPPVLSIGTVMALSTALVTLEAFEKFTTENFSDLFRPAGICSRAE